MDHFIRLHVLILREGDGWAAQCLEFDLAAQGSTVREAQDAFERVFQLQIALDKQDNKMPFEGLKRAPDSYWDRAREAMRLGERIPLRAPRDVPPAYMIRAQAEYQLSA